MTVLGRATTTGAAYCPHCFLQVADDVPLPWPEQLARCPHCRLTIGPGRAHDTPEEAGPGARGTAAGIYAHEARAAESSDDGGASQERVRAGIRSAAAKSGSRPDRLLMIEYQQHAAEDPDLPALSDVFAAFGSWKRARREAA